jgi:hypothetical protein
MAKNKPSSWLALDSLLLILCVVLLLVDVIIVQDMVLALVALGGVFIFSVRLGRDVRSRKTP